MLYRPPTNTIEQRVAKGAALLDKEFPYWFDKIDIGTLDIIDCHQCILGQLFGEEASETDTGFTLGIYRLGLGCYQSVEHGFGCYNSVDATELAEEWVNAIRERWETHELATI